MSVLDSVLLSAEFAGARLALVNVPFSLPTVFYQQSGVIADMPEMCYK